MTSIRIRLFGILALVTALVWGAAVVWVEIHTRHEVQRVLDRRLMESARMVSSLMRTGEMTPVVNPVLPGPVPAYERQLSCQIWTVNGELIARSQNAPAESLAPDEDGFSERVIEGEWWRVYTVHMPDDGYRVMVGDSLTIREHLISSVVTGLLGPAALGLAALGVLIWWSVGAGLRPVRQMTRILTERDADDLSPIGVAPGGSDLQPFVQSLDALMDRVRAARLRETEFTAAAAHELRTPLAGLRIQAQIAAATGDEQTRRHALEQIQVSVDRTARLVTGLLALAREDVTAIDDREKRWTGLAAHFEALGAEPRLQLPDADVEVFADPDRFSLVAANLLANARQFARSRISLSVQGEGPFAVIAVDDDGPGVTTADLERLGQRFFRPSGSPGGGSGLGLSIVVSAVKAHGGAVRFAPSAMGGLRVELHGLAVRRRLSGRVSDDS
ncbi:two-component sensor histidine kinase [Brevundimonas sp. LPMIX5]|uniref:ATP-binding protein n=1 Tax=Brevundimonas sp. LPMIX5 TaxID=2305887 RepID=UPI000E67250A|nr:ATP-binding protein [Brevundimonas sp. LPMIX5]RIJ68645.1 two-component sensor histidine kinase [Brevundimonas sp. LPMIX5]